MENVCEEDNVREIILDFVKRKFKKFSPTHMLAVRTDTPMLADWFVYDLCGGEEYLDSLLNNEDAEAVRIYMDLC